MKQLLFILFLSNIIASCASRVTEENFRFADLQQKYGGLPKAEKMKLVQAGMQLPAGFLQGLGGDTIAFSKSSKKITVVDFWAIWCSPCLELMPNLQEAAKKYSEKGVEILTVSIDGDKASWADFVADQNWEQNAYWVGENADNPLYWFTYAHYPEDTTTIITAIPQYAIISPEGLILEKGFVSNNPAYFEEKIEKYIGGSQ